MKNFKCEYCDLTLKGKRAANRHYKDVHPDNNNPIKFIQTDIKSPILTNLRDAQAKIRTLLPELEAERDMLSRKLLEYDDVIAKYKKLI